MLTTIYDVIGLINIILIAIILFLGIWILVMFKDVEIEILKARLFLKADLIKKMWLYSACAGGFFVIHEVVGVLGQFSSLEIKGLYILTDTFFIAAFLLLTYSWYKVFKASVKK